MAQGSRSTFGKYVLLRKLASGGMGEIFLAKQRGPSGFEKLLVIKRILSHHLDKKDYLDMFFSEAKLVARLHHHNIIQIHEMGEIDGDYYIAMEYVRGKSLRDVIDELRAEGSMLPLPHVIDLAIKLCEGLGYAHQARDIRGRPMNIVHRDINPHNVLISYTGDLKLIDFGIAKSEMTSVHTATGTIKGKFVYMSPEQSAADPIDRRSDIFSLGIVIYEMLCLENPFVRQNVVLSLEAIQRHEVPPPSTKRADAGPLDEILLRSLAKKPEDRFQTATEMRDELRNLFRDGLVRPADEDLTSFLSALFAADIAEEDRLLAEADQATATPGLPTAPLAAAAEPPPAQTAPARRATPTPILTSPFADEEPTLAGEDYPVPRPKSDPPWSGASGRPVPEAPSRSMGLLPGEEDEDEGDLPPPAVPKSRSQPELPNGQMFTLIPPEEVVPGTGDELLADGPTRSDRVPKPSSSSDEDELAASSALGEAEVEPPPMRALALRSDLLSEMNASPFAEPVPGDHPPEAPAPIPAREPPLEVPPTARVDRGAYLRDNLRDNRSSDSLPPHASVPDHVTDEEDTGFPAPSPPWRRLGSVTFFLTVLVVTGFGGFFATKALLGPKEGSAVPPILPLEARAEVKAAAVAPAPLEVPPIPVRGIGEPDEGEEPAEVGGKPLEERSPRSKDRPREERPRDERPSKAEAARLAREERAAKAEAAKAEAARLREERAAKVEAAKAAKAAKAAEREAKRAAEVAPAPERALDKALEKVAPPKVEEPKVETARAEAPKAGAERLGSLVVRAGSEVAVEVDGRAAGSSPSTVVVKKTSGRIKLYSAEGEHSITLEYTVEGGGIAVRVESSPWAILKHNGLSVGRTPQSVGAGSRHQLELMRPGQSGPFSVTLSWTPKS